MELREMKDEEFDALYPIKIRKLSSTHWTPVDVAKKAVEFLCGIEGKSILDLGSGTGKFCLIAAANVEIKITGVEQRENLVQISRKLAAKFHLQNLNFIHDDLINLDFSNYDAFYFFNSFEENINLTDKLDKDNRINLELYHSLITIIRDKFDGLPIGTRIVTYCGDATEIPADYLLIKFSNKGKLRYWEKLS